MAWWSTRPDVAPATPASPTAAAPAPAATDNDFKRTFPSSRVPAGCRVGGTVRVASGSQVTCARRFVNEARASSESFEGHEERSCPDRLRPVIGAARTVRPTADGYRVVDDWSPL